MKIIKNALCMIMALALLLSISVSAFAAGRAESKEGTEGSDKKAEETKTDDTEEAEDEKSNSTIYIICGAAVVAAAAVAAVVIVKKRNGKDSEPSGMSTVPPTMPVKNIVPPAPPKPGPIHPKDHATVIAKGGAIDGKHFGIVTSAVIGRDAGADIRVENSTVSNRHCKLERINGKLYITDLGSSNGTFLNNGSKLPANTKVELENGSEFTLADKKVSFKVKL